MAILRFKAADVRRIVEHSIGNKQREETIDYDREGRAVTRPVSAPAVLLVHDQGVYLMSNGEPRDILPSDDAREGEGRSYVAYAEGCDPEKNPDDWWDTARALVGGDDFGETLPWAVQIKDAIDRGANEVRIKLSGSKIALDVVLPRKAVA